MRRYVKHAVVLAVVALTVMACSHKETTDTTILAKVYNVDNETVTLAYPSRDTLHLCLPDSVRRQAGNILVDDAAAVTYRNETIVDFVVIYHGKPQINNVNAMLIGTWHSQNKIPEFSSDITFNAAGTLSYLASAEKLQNRKWELCGSELYILAPSGATAYKYDILRLDDSTLTISNSEGKTLRFAKEF